MEIAFTCAHVLFHGQQRGAKARDVVREDTDEATMDEEVDEAVTQDGKLGGVVAHDSVGAGFGFRKVCNGMKKV